MIINAIFENVEPRDLKVLYDGEIPSWIDASEITGVQFGPSHIDRELDTIVVTPVSVDVLLSIPTSIDEATKSMKVQLCKFSLDELGIGKWIPFGRLHYTTRRFEDVTLLRTLELSEIRYLQPLEYDDVRRPYQRLEDMILRALLILNRGLEGCVSSTCKVMLDTRAKMYRVVFTDRDSENVIGEILIRRTVDLLEILRRPDTDCEPVIVKEQRLIWNRFRDISYDEDVALLKPWVARRNPFPEMSLNLPPTAQDLLSSSKELDITIELYHDPWTCPLKHISLEDIDRQHRLARSVKHHYLFDTGSSYGEPVHVSNEPGVHHGSCWRVHIDTPIKITPELREIIETRFTDGQVRSLLSSQEIIYWSEERQTWVTHTFKLVVRESCIEEVKESWHLRMMVAELTGQRYDSQFPGLYLQNPDTWNPYIIIEPEYVTVGLRKKETRQTREKRVSERNVALKYRFQVQELLEGEMKGLLEELGIVPNRRLTSEIQGAISDSLEIYGLKEGKAEVEFDGVIIEQDTVGGRILFVVLVSELEIHKVPVTGHLHDIRQIGRIRRAEFESEVRSLLEEYNLTDVDRARAVSECIKVMKEEKLITR